MASSTTIYNTIDSVKQKRRDILNLIEMLKNEIPNSFFWKRILIKLSKDYYDIDGLYKHLTKKEEDFIREYCMKQMQEAERITDRLRRRRRARRYSPSDIEDRAMAEHLESETDYARAIFDDHSLNPVSDEEIAQNPFWWNPIDDEENPPAQLEQENPNNEEFDLDEFQWPSL